jgi:hypothetical protein
MYERIRTLGSDSIDCLVCGAELHRWSEARVYTARLIERHELPK